MRKNFRPAPCALAIGAVLGTSCGGAAPPVRETGEAVAEESALSRQPPRVRELAVKPAPDGRGTTLLVAFERDENEKERLGSFVSLSPDGRETLELRDDGEKGDEARGDAIFSAVTDLDFEALMESRKRLFDELSRAQQASAPIFDGRAVVGERKLFAEHALGGFAFPFGFPGLIDAGRSLMVTDLSVVEDPARTFNPCTGAGTAMGKWTFGHLMTAMAGSGDAAIFVQRWLEQWLTARTVNGFTVPERPLMSDILASWPKTATGALDLARAPFKLLAIVNRIDLAKNSAYAPAGEAEGRFVFQWMDPKSCTAEPRNPFLVILEYGVPRTGCSALKDWARKWRQLSFTAMPSALYNSRLEALTDVFAEAGADPAAPNGSALNQIRTNDFKLRDRVTMPLPWELREFVLQRRYRRTPWGPIELPALLAQTTVKQTPDDATWNGKNMGPRAAELASWVNANASLIATEDHTVPAAFPFAPGGGFLGGAAPNRFDFWTAPGIVGAGSASASDVRHKFSINTCNGCHGRETNDPPVASEKFTHVRAVAGWGAQAGLSGFLLGTDVTDPDPTTGAGVVRHFEDLTKRKIALNSFAGAFCGPFFSPELAIDVRQLEPDPVVPFAGIEHQPTRSVH